MSRWWLSSGPAVVPLSFAQSRLWFIDQLQGPSPVYNMATAFRIGGALDVEALAAALADVVGRHEIAAHHISRTSRVMPQQLVVAPERAEFGWDVVDATGWSAARLEEASEAAARHRFDLTTRDPVAGAAFPRRRGRACVGGRGAPHRRRRLVGDPAGGVIWVWPMPAGVRAGPRSGLPLAVQYVDYTLWQRAQFGDLDDGDSPIAAQLAYWQDALAGMPERLPLPTDRPYPPVADQRGARVAVDWPAELQQRVREVAAEHNATSFMVIQAALAVLLSRLSASSDVAVGFPIAGRGDPALDELVGFFVNTLVLRVDLAGDPTIAELLAQVRRRSLAAFEHQDVPFEVLVERLNPTRSLTHHPLVQVLLAWQNLPGHTRRSRRRVGLG